MIFLALLLLGSPSDDRSRDVKTYIKTHAETVTFAAAPGDAAKATSALCPVGAVVLGISGKVLISGTTCTSINIGDGSDADRYGATIAKTAGTTFKPSDATASWVEAIFTSARNVTVTGVGGNCVSLSIRLTCHYVDVPSPY